MKHQLLLASLVTLLGFAAAPSAIQEEDWVQVGVVGVDSGQLAILDPTYIDSEWVRDGDGADWQVQYWGRDEAKLKPEFGPSPIKCKNADEAKKLDARIKQHAKDNNITAVTWLQSGSTYDKCAALTMTDKGHGQLNYRAGHKGLGVVASSGYGDGTYPVYARRNAEGVIVELRVMLDEDGAGAKRMKELIERQKKAAKKGK